MFGLDIPKSVRVLGLCGLALSVPGWGPLPGCVDRLQALQPTETPGQGHPEAWEQPFDIATQVLTPGSETTHRFCYPFFFFILFFHKHVCVHAQSLQSYLTLCNHMNYSPPGYSVNGILQARILEWVAMASSRGSSRPRDWTCVSCIASGFLTTELPGKPFHKCIRT